MGKQFSATYQPTEAQRVKAKAHVFRRRLLALADLLETDHVKKHFDYGTWIDVDRWGGKANLSCGTTACALGWATTMPALRKAGLWMGKDGMPRLRKVHPAEGWPATIAEALFGLKESVSSLVFGLGGENYRKRTAHELCVNHIDGSSETRPEAVANLIREVAAVLYPAKP